MGHNLSTWNGKKGFYFARIVPLLPATATLFLSLFSARLISGPSILMNVEEVIGLTSRTHYASTKRIFVRIRSYNNVRIRNLTAY